MRLRPKIHFKESLVTKAPQPYIDYLASASPTTLRARELACLNQFATHRAEAFDLLASLLASEAYPALRITSHPAVAPRSLGFPRPPLAGRRPIRTRLVFATVAA
jgi:hypothetical protein